MKVTLKLTPEEVECHECERKSGESLDKYFDKMVSQTDEFIAAVFDFYAVDNKITITDKQVDKPSLSVTVQFELDPKMSVFSLDDDDDEQEWMETLSFMIFDKGIYEQTKYSYLDNKDLVKVAISALHFVDSNGAVHNAEDFD